MDSGEITLRKHQLRTFAEYGVMYADYPKLVTDGTLADVMQGQRALSQKVNSQLLSMGRVSVGGYPVGFSKSECRM